VTDNNPQNQPDPQTNAGPQKKTGSQATPNPQTKPKTWAYFFAVVLLAFASDAYLIQHHSGAESPQWYWGLTVALITALCASAGYLVNQRFDGILINDRNRISLGRLQWVAWLIVLMSALFVEALWNAGLSSTDHAATIPSMPEQLLGLLGIVSGTTLVSGVISNNKKQTRAPAAATATGAAPSPVAAGDDPTDAGQMDANKSPADASWADLYLGEEVANRYVVDISRLQKLLITIILIAIYIGWLWNALHNGGRFDKLPGLGADNSNNTFLWLLGISHAGYIASKATPKTTTGVQAGVPAPAPSTQNDAAGG
jgi:hypothetical protein